MKFLFFKLYYLLLWIKKVLIPYRDSKLTRLLAEYFHPSQDILMILNVKLTELDIKEQYNDVLNFGGLTKEKNLFFIEKVPKIG